MAETPSASASIQPRRDHRLLHRLRLLPGDETWRPLARSPRSTHRSTSIGTSAGAGGSHGPASSYRVVVGQLCGPASSTPRPWRFAPFRDGDTHVGHVVRPDRLVERLARARPGSAAPAGEAARAGSARGRRVVDDRGRERRSSPAASPALLLGQRLGAKEARALEVASAPSAEKKRKRCARRARPRAAGAPWPAR